MMSCGTVRLIVTFAAIGIAPGCLAQDATVLLVDRDSGRPVAEAAIRIYSDNGSWEFETDAGGQASLAGLPPGTYRVEIEKTGYLDPADPAMTGRNFRIPSSTGTRLLIGVVRAVVVAGQIADERGQARSGISVLQMC